MRKDVNVPLINSSLCAVESDVGGELVVFDTSFNLEIYLATYTLAKHGYPLTVSIEACRKLRASRPTQTLSIEKSPPLIIDEPL
jgi:hypothetical protein